MQTDEGWVNTQYKSNKKQKMCSAFTKDLLVIKIRVAHLFSVLCSPIMCLYVLGSVLWFPHTNDGWFVLYLQ
jgi:predicted permease